MLLFASEAFCKEHACLTLRPETAAHNADQIAHCLGKPRLVKKITYQADVHIDQKELDYLIGIKPGQWVTQEMLNRAVSYLWQKQKY